MASKEWLLRTFKQMTRGLTLSVQIHRRKGEEVVDPMNIVVDTLLDTVKIGDLFFFSKTS